MKFSLLKNDKSTVKDEVILGLMIVLSLIVGILLIVFRPSFWMIGSNITVVTGVIIVAFGIMFVPSLIYRLRTNDKMKKQSAEFVNYSQRNPVLGIFLQYNVTVQNLIPRQYITK